MDMLPEKPNQGDHPIYHTQQQSSLDFKIPGLRTVGKDRVCELPDHHLRLTTMLTHACFFCKAAWGMKNHFPRELIFKCIGHSPSAPSSQLP